MTEDFMSPSEALMTVQVYGMADDDDDLPGCTSRLSKKRWAASQTLINAVHALEDIRMVLWGLPNDERPISADKEWDVDTLMEIASILNDRNLGPES